MAAANNRFTEEQMAYLKANRYVATANRNTVHFTAAFKERFWEMYTQENMRPMEIVRELGIDTKILGRARIRGLAQNLKKEYARYGKFIDIIRGKPMKIAAASTLEEEVSRLRVEVEYLKQEREFLKKIISAGTKGESKC